jgi:hypothetical protein
MYGQEFSHELPQQALNMESNLDPHLRGLIRAGDTIMWGQAHAQPLSLVEALVQQRHGIGRMRLLLGIGQGLESMLRAEHADAFDFVSYCGAGSNRSLARAGVLDILPLHYSEMKTMCIGGGQGMAAVFERA